MRKLLVLVAVGFSLLLSRAGSASSFWSLHGAESSSGAQLAGTCNFSGAGNCSLSIDGGAAFGTAAPSSFAYTVTSTDFRLDVPSFGTSSVFSIDPTLYSTGGPMDVLLALHDDQGVAFAGAPDATPDLSLLEGASVQFSVTLIPTPYLYSLCPSCGGPVSRSFTIDTLVPEPSSAALALVGVFGLTLTRRLKALATR